MKRNFLSFVVAATLLPLLAAGQADVHFSQFYETSILRNPSLTGVFSNDYKVGAYHRNQWSSIGNAYVTNSGYGEVRFATGRVSDDYMSFGLLGYVDRAGSIDQRITCIYPAFNFSKSLNVQRNSYLSVGFTGGYNQYSFDRSKVTTDNQFLSGVFNENNPTGEQFGNTSMNMWDLGAGINYNSSAGVGNAVTYMIGIAGYHLTQPKFTYLNVPGVTQNMRLNINAACAFDVGERYSAQVHMNVAQQGTNSEKLVGGLMSYTQPEGAFAVAYALSAGCFYRLGDAVIPVVKLRYRNSAVAVSYDVNISGLTPASRLRGGTEITFSLSGNFTEKNAVLKKTVCPKF
jgi:type IX secretion system PorP/SprF family membrane protein